MGNRNKSSRRQFLENSGRAALMMTAFDTIFGSLMQSQVARAATAGPFKKFIHINMYNAPPRWMFDLILNPTGEADRFIANKQVSNFYKAESATAPYTTTGYRTVVWGDTGIHVPHLWSHKVALSGGREVKAGNLFNNVLSVRGIDVLNAGHAGANELHQAGVVGAPTISSVTADRATANPANSVENIVKAMFLDPQQPSIFKSTNNLSAFAAALTASVDAKKNNLVKLFGSMQPLNNTLGADNSGNRAALSAEINAAMKAMDPASAYYYANLNRNNQAATKILTDQTITAFDSLAADWTPLFNKYMDNIARTLAIDYAGIDDRRIGEVVTGAALRPYQLTEGKFAQNKVSGKVDLRSILANVDYSRLAAQFATIEFLIRYDICPSISVIPTVFTDISADFHDGTDFTGNMTFDQHNYGVMPGVFINTKYFLALSSCLLEMVDVLKAQHKFDDTLIYMNGEFNRSALTDGSGSDHGADATSVSLISGRIPQFKVVGNIYRDAAGVETNYGTKYKGTWGHGAPIKGAVLNIPTFWASVMTLLGFPQSELPNIVDRSRLLFKTAGSFAVTSGFDQAVNVKNTSK